eukprot:jgi/Hompol1/6452/HPOL_003457-RA
MLEASDTDIEDFKKSFESQCVKFGESITIISAGLRDVLARLSTTGVLDASGHQLEYNVTTAGAEKDLEILTNGIMLIRSLLAPYHDVHMSDSV